MYLWESKISFTVEVVNIHKMVPKEELFHQVADGDEDVRSVTFFPLLSLYSMSSVYVVSTLSSHPMYCILSCLTCYVTLH